VIALAAGDPGRVVSITPPLGIDPEILESALDALAESLA
jgi:4-aminobutyrate aminotransferase-like enzyme